ncbi:DNA helicase rad5 [Vermiconidia calcicola]|uniref:DNA helicase rad5 n=1 Tax=Vermiconidia calcicola TaxID=1690605 RepID=A0ACC3N1Q9_9PEZI|nr:DNA helicase rad5 [Vermiconidia calcicola]
MADVQERPHKKRRFFVDDSPEQDSTFINEPSLPDEVNTLPENTTFSSTTSGLPKGSGDAGSFDRDTFNAITGADLPSHAYQDLQRKFGDNVEQAINAYFDGSWKLSPSTEQRQPTQDGATSAPSPRQPTQVRKAVSPKPASSPPPKPPGLDSMPRMRYIGALGVAGWATKSGTGLVKPEDIVKIERTKTPVVQKTGRGGKAKQSGRKNPDVVVRFTDSRGSELGRLEQEAATWISALLDQKVCEFEGHCIYAPERLRTNDTVYLQLRCYLLKQAFEASNYIKPQENNRQTGIFEAKETQDERDLRIRQIGLVKLFSEINLQPSTVNETTAKHKREGILQAAEVAEQYEDAAAKRPSSSSGKSTPAENGGSSPPSEENEEGEELEQDQLDTLYKKAQSFDFNTPEAEPAHTFAMDLRKYQRQALHWMLNKETSQGQGHKEQSMHPLWEEYKWPIKDAEDKDLPVVTDQDSFYVNPYSGELGLDFPVQEQNCLGGVLADEMGLGKTIEMLSLIHTHASPEQEAAMNNTGKLDSVNSLPRLHKSTGSVEQAPATTLVVAPMSLLAQWASEAEKASKNSSLKVLVYYGSEKSVNLQTLCHASNAASAPNLIITSYGTVLSEFNSVASLHAGNKGSSGGLFSLEYFRIILDEAHMIKNRQSKTAKACYELAAIHRWVLTGTPIVNRLEDLFSLVRFLRVEPWSNFSFWKTFITTPFEKGDFVRALDVVQTVLEPLVLRRTKDMRTPDGEALVPLPPRTIEIEKVELSVPEREVYNHIYARAKRTFAANVEAGTLMKSYTTIFAQILRLRQSCCHPILTRNKNIVAEEEDAAATSDIANGLADDMDLSALLERFEAEEGEQDASKFGSHVLKQIQDEAEMECPICSEEPMVDQAVTGCWHSACKKCLLDYIEHQSAKGELPRCFNCREPVNARDVFEVIRHEDEDDEEEAGERLVDAMDVDGDEEEEDLYSSTQPARPHDKKEKPPARISLRRVNQLSSAKINTLLSQLKKLKKAEPNTKCVVFSQFTSFLDLLTPALNSSNIPFLRFDGSMSQKERAKTLTTFALRPKFTVLLLSLRAGGVGLNLTCAKRVFMMDPWWSFAVEAQAIDRVHRMGQTEAVKVTRFVVGESIEEKMLRVQERKKFIATSLGMMSDEEKRTQRIEDIKELLS